MNGKNFVVHNMSSFEFGTKLIFAFICGGLVNYMPAEFPTLLNIVFALFVLFCFCLVFQSQIADEPQGENNGA